MAAASAFGRGVIGTPADARAVAVAGTTDRFRRLRPDLIGFIADRAETRRRIRPLRRTDPRAIAVAAAGTLYDDAAALASHIALFIVGIARDVVDAVGIDDPVTALFTAATAIASVARSGIGVIAFLFARRFPIAADGNGRRAG